MALYYGGQQMGGAYYGGQKVNGIYGGVALFDAGGAGPALKSGTLTNPPFSMGLNWDWGYAMVHNPFLDWLKLGTDWQSSGAGNLNWSALLAAGHINASGAVLSIPAGADNIVMYALQLLTNEDGNTTRYRLTWTGAGTVWLSGASNENEDTPNQIEFDYTATGGNQLAVMVVAAPVTLTGLVRVSDAPAFDAGEVFRPAWLDLIRNERVLRFKDWSRVDNYDGSPDWTGRAQVGRVNYTGPEGVPYEHMIALCNKVGADPWFVLPHTATDAYSSGLAALALAGLDAKRHTYLEYTHKYWDFNLSQAGYTQAQGDALFGGSGLDNSYNFYGGRAAEHFMLWNAVWAGADNARLHKVLQVWTDNHGNEQVMYDATKWVALDGSRSAPATYATECAVHGLIDGGLGSNETTSINIVQGWMDTMTTAQLYDRFELAVRDHASGPMGEGRSLARLLGDWAYHAGAASTRGLTTIMYEGGTHIVTPPARQGNETWAGLYNGFHYSAQFGAVWGDVIDGFYTQGGTIMNKYMDVKRPNAIANEGLRRYLTDTNPQVTAWETQRATRAGPAGRGADAFIGPQDMAAGT